MFDDPVPALQAGPLLSFAERPANATAVPRSGSAVYTIWNRAGAFVYFGMSGHSTDAKGPLPFGRLNSHAGGRRSGDQFSGYISDRFVLTQAASCNPEIATGYLSLDTLNRNYTLTKLGFRIAALLSPTDAFTVEWQLRRENGLQIGPSSTPQSERFHVMEEIIDCVPNTHSVLPLCSRKLPQAEVR